jgi:hypothetical protein
MQISSPISTTSASVGRHSSPTGHAFDGPRADLTRKRSRAAYGLMGI